MKESFEPTSKSVENSGEVKINSRLGIRCDHGFDTLLLNIPRSVFDKLGDRDAIRTHLHPQVFNGSFSMGEQDHEDWHTVELHGGTSIEKIQQLVDAIENLHDQKNEQ